MRQARSKGNGKVTNEWELSLVDCSIHNFSSTGLTLWPYDMRRTTYAGKRNDASLRLLVHVPEETKRAKDVVNQLSADRAE